MATLIGSHAGPTVPVPGLPVPRGVTGVAWGYYAHASNLAATTIIRYCKVPAGATVIGGFFQATDLDSGTEELNIDLGWAANGTDNADTDGFGNFDVITGDASVHLPVAGIYLPFINIIQSPGFKTFAAETFIEAVINVDAETGGTGLSKVVVWYV